MSEPLEWREDETSLALICVGLASADPMAFSSCLAALSDGDVLGSTPVSLETRSRLCGESREKTVR